MALDPRGPNKFEPTKRKPFPTQNPPVGDHDKQDRKRKELLDEQNKKGK